MLGAEGLGAEMIGEEVIGAGLVLRLERDALRVVERVSVEPGKEKLVLRSQ